MTVTILYFALLREQRGLDREQIAVTQETAADLYKRLQNQFAFTLPSHFVKYAINGEFVDQMTMLHDGDEVVFVPPVAGG